MKKPVVTEVINFLHELDLLEAHLEESQHFVDRIVVIESAVTYSGMPKKLYFDENKKRFTRFNVEHEIVPTDVFKPVPQSYPEAERKHWFDVRRNNREANVSRAFRRYKKGCDYIISADADEIWSRDHWYLIQECMDKDWCYIAPLVRRFLLYINCPASISDHWRITRSDMRSHVRKRGTPRGQTREEVGWHFSSCYKDVHDLWMKGVGICQSAGYLGVDNLPSLEEIQRRLDKQYFPFMNKPFTPKRYQTTGDDVSWLPKFMQENLDLFPWFPEQFAKDEWKAKPNWKLR